MNCLNLLINTLLENESNSRNLLHYFNLKLVEQAIFIIFLLLLVEVANTAVITINERDNFWVTNDSIKTRRADRGNLARRFLIYTEYLPFHLGDNFTL